MEYLISLIYFVLPAGIANMMPVIVSKVPLFNVPIDLGKSWNGRPLLGKNKTWRGIFFGVLASILFTYFQHYFYSNAEGFNLIKNRDVSPLILGFLLGFGALFGDLLKSFFKRRLNVPPGISWFPFDQVDWVVGLWLFTFWYAGLSLYDLFLLVVLALIFHPMVNYLGYLLRLKKNRF